MYNTFVRRIGILTGGGDAPGLNAVIRAVVHTAAHYYDIEVLGLRDGYDGLVEPDRVTNLTRADVRGILDRGGTILGAANRGNPFARHLERDGHVTVVDMSDQAVHNIDKLQLSSLIVVGGDGTLRISKELCDKGAPIISVPKTIDNDVGGTDVTFGFDTALQTATQAIDRLHSTAESHHRVMLLELMGRDAGWISLGAGIAGGADAILIPEIPFHLQPVLDKIDQRAQMGRHFSILAVAEGARHQDGPQIYKSTQQASHEPRLGGIGQDISTQITKQSGVETRCTVLGHLQRGGSPSPFDRWLATCYGAAAVHLAADQKHGRMVNCRRRIIGDISLADALSSTPKLVDPNSLQVATARGLGIVFGDEISLPPP